MISLLSASTQRQQAYACLGLPLPVTYSTKSYSFAVGRSSALLPCFHFATFEAVFASLMFVLTVPISLHDSIGLESHFESTVLASFV